VRERVRATLASGDAIEHFEALETGGARDGI
jgi:hypothetical protein